MCGDLFNPKFILNAFWWILDSTASYNNLCATNFEIYFMRLRFSHLIIHTKVNLKKNPNKNKNIHPVSKCYKN